MSEAKEVETAVIVCSPKSWRTWTEAQVRNCRECSGEVWASPTSVKMEAEHLGPVEFLCMPCMAADPPDVGNDPFRPVPGSMEEIKKLTTISEQDKRDIEALTRIPLREIPLAQMTDYVNRKEFGL